VNLFKRFLACAMVVVLAFGVVACGNKDAATTNEDGITEIVWYTLGNKQEDAGMVYDTINEKLAKYGLKVKFEVIDQGAYNDKMNLVISSGEYYDICFTSNWANNFMNNVQKGAYLNLNEYLANNKALMEYLPDYLWNGVTYNGNIYAVPNQQVVFTQPVLTLPQRLVEKYNFDLSTIKTFKDIEPMLEVLKNNEKSIYPYRVNNTRNPLEYTYEGITGTPLAIKKVANKDEHTAYLYDALPERKAHLELMKEWFDKGYIRKDALTVTSDTADVDNLKYGFVWGTYKPGAEAEWKIKYGEELAYVKIGEPYVTATATQATACAISAKSKNPEAALKVLEIFNTDKEIYNLMAFGIEGVHYTKIGENQIKLSDDNKYKPNDAWKYGDQFNAYCTEDQDVTVWEETKTINESAIKSPLTGFSLDLTNIKSEIAQINSIGKEYAYLTTGAGYDEDKYEEYLNKLETAGAQKVLDEVNKQLDEFFASK